MTDLCAMDAVTLAGMLRRRDVSAREVTAARIQRIEDTDGAVNAVVTRTFDAALDQAARADEALARGAEPGPLHGLPVAHKDLHDTAGVRTTYGSVLFADHVPDRDALVVARMSQAGAISLGKTNTPEFGAGSHTVNPVFGATRNPYDLSRSAGGSSGGAAAALAARMISLADGSDLGGSLRNPASFCNVTGLRPSPGRVPSWPFTDVADVLGVEGPMAARSPTSRCCCPCWPARTRGCRWRWTRRAATSRQIRSRACWPATCGASGSRGARTSACRWSRRC